MDIVQVDAGAAAGAGTSADHGAVHEQEEEEIAAVERVEGGGDIVWRWLPRLRLWR